MNVLLICPDCGAATPPFTPHRCVPRRADPTEREKRLDAALVKARRFIWERLLCTDGGAQMIRDIDAALAGRDGS